MGVSYIMKNKYLKHIITILQNATMTFFKSTNFIDPHLNK